MLALDYHQTFKDPEPVLARITDLIGTDRFGQAPTLLHQRAQPESLDASPPVEADVQHLVDLYADDLARFATLSGVDVSAWPTARILAGDLAAADLAERLAAKVTFTTEVPADVARRRQRRDDKRARRKARREASQAEGDDGSAAAPGTESASDRESSAEPPTGTG